MSIKLSDTQLVLLSAASQREDHNLTPPSGARLASAKKAAAKLLKEGLVREVRARKDAPVWRRDEEADQGFALKLTAAGLKAIAADLDTGDDEAARLTKGDEAVKLERRRAGSMWPTPYLVRNRAGSPHRRAFLAPGPRSAPSSRCLRGIRERPSTNSSPPPGGCRIPLAPP